MSDEKPVVFDDDNPEWTEADFARAVRFDGRSLPEVVDELRRRGRPPGAGPGPTKQQVTLRLDRDILDRFRAGGPGWQSRINEALRKAAG